MNDSIWSADSKPRSTRVRRPFWIALGFAFAVHLIVLTSLHLPAIHTAEHTHEQPVAVSIETPRPHRPTPRSTVPAKQEPKKHPVAQPKRKSHPRQTASQTVSRQPSRSVKPSKRIKRPAAPIETKHSPGKIDVDAWARKAAQEAAQAKRKPFDKPPSVPFESEPREPLPALRNHKPRSRSAPTRTIGEDHSISKIGNQCYTTAVSTPKATSPLPPRDPIFSTSAVHCPNEPKEESFTEGLAKRLKALDRARKRH